MERSPVRAKKHLGQHFLTDEHIAVEIVAALDPSYGCTDVLEIGPGTGVLTKYLLERKDIHIWASEIDGESIAYLKEKFPALRLRLLQQDFLQLNLATTWKESIGIIGNFPYNISSQILFHILEYRDKVPVMVGMFQKEVAERVVSGPGNRDYGIVSVLLQPWYDMEYLMTVEANAFNPPPKVKSAVIRMVRNERTSLGVSEESFKRLIKLAFNQRRKTLRNAIRSVLPDDYSAVPYLDLRAERLGWQQYVELVKILGL
jgi:16S rRNA (adenine1518-N6/adenine1519-N6)-dimethyltransferase